MSEKFTVLIVDDEPMARVALKRILEENFPQVHILAEVNGVPEAVKSIYSLKPDVVFLDIEMPGYSGIEILDFFENRHIPSKIVFVTAYEEYALKAFELSAVDYLLKPVCI
jgi:two-component system LytT family response regulator